MTIKCTQYHINLCYKDNYNKLKNNPSIPIVEKIIISYLDEVNKVSIIELKPKTKIPKFEFIKTQ